MRQRSIWLVAGALVALGATQASAGRLEVGRVAGQPGQSVTVPVTYQARAGAVLTALSTDVRFDNELVNPRCAAGAAMAGGGADKTVRCAQVGPGLLRVLVFGFNQDPIPEGEVATITFDIVSNARRRLHVLRSLPQGADANGEDLRVLRKNGMVRIGRK